MCMYVYVCVCMYMYLNVCMCIYIYPPLTSIRWDCGSFIANATIIFVSVPALLLSSRPLFQQIYHHHITITIMLDELRFSQWIMSSSNILVSIAVCITPM